MSVSEEVSSHPLQQGVQPYRARPMASKPVRSRVAANRSPRQQGRGVSPSDVSTNADSAFSLLGASDHQTDSHAVRGCLVSTFLCSAQLVIVLASIDHTFMLSLGSSVEGSGWAVGMMFACESLGVTVFGSFVRANKFVWPLVLGLNLAGSALLCTPALLTDNYVLYVLYGALGLLGLTFGATQVLIQRRILHTGKTVLAVREGMVQAGTASAVGQLVGSLLGVVLATDALRSYPSGLTFSSTTNPGMALPALSLVAIANHVFLKRYSRSRGRSSSLEQGQSSAIEAAAKYRALVGPRGFYHTPTIATRMRSFVTLFLAFVYVYGARTIHTLLTPVLGQGSVCGGPFHYALSCLYNPQQTFVVWSVVSLASLAGVLLGRRLPPPQSLRSVLLVSAFACATGFGLMIDWAEQTQFWAFMCGVCLASASLPFFGAATTALHIRNGGWGGWLLSLTCLLSTVVPFWQQYVQSKSSTEADMWGAWVYFGVPGLLFVLAFSTVLALSHNPVLFGNAKDRGWWRSTVPESEIMDGLPLWHLCGIPMFPVATNSIVSVAHDPNENEDV